MRRRRMRRRCGIAREHRGEGLPNPVFVKDTLHRWVLLNAASCGSWGGTARSLSGEVRLRLLPGRRGPGLDQGRRGAHRLVPTRTRSGSPTPPAAPTSSCTPEELPADRSARHRFAWSSVPSPTSPHCATSGRLRRSRDALEGRVRERTTKLQGGERAPAPSRTRTGALACTCSATRSAIPWPAVLASTRHGACARGSPIAGRAGDVLKRQGQVLTRLCDGDPRGEPDRARKAQSSARALRRPNGSNFMLQRAHFDEQACSCWLAE